MQRRSCGFQLVVLRGLLKLIGARGGGSACPEVAIFLGEMCCISAATRGASVSFFNRDSRTAPTGKLHRQKERQNSEKTSGHFFVKSDAGWPCV